MVKFVCRYIFPFLTQWFAAILSATEMTKIGHNNPFLFTVHAWILTTIPLSFFIIILLSIFIQGSTTELHRSGDERIKQDKVTHM